MYRSDLNNRDKGGAITAVVAIHAALAFAFLHVSGTVDLTDPQSAIQVFDVREILAPPPPRHRCKSRSKSRNQKPKRGPLRQEHQERSHSGGRAEARIEIPVPPKIAVSETPREGASPTQGASDVRGPGTGAGGIGTGPGSGGAGTGPGGGGDGGTLKRHDC